MDAVTNFKIKSMSLQLLVANVDRSVEFYSNYLGFDVDFRYEDFYAGIVKDGCSIHLKEGMRLINKSADTGVDTDLDVLFSVDGIAKLYQGFVDQSLEIVQPLREMPYGKEFYIADPDGYIIGFVDNAQTIVAN